ARHLFLRILNAVGSVVRQDANRSTCGPKFECTFLRQSGVPPLLPRSRLHQLRLPPSIEVSEARDYLGEQIQMLRWYIALSMCPLHKGADSPLSSMTAPVEALLIGPRGNAFSLIVFHVMASVVRLSELRQ